MFGHGLAERDALSFVVAEGEGARPCPQKRMGKYAGNSYRWALLTSGVPPSGPVSMPGVLTPNDMFRGELDSVEREAVAETRNPAMFRDFLDRLGARLKRSGVAGQLRDELIAMDYMRSWWSNYVANMLPLASLTVAAWAAIAGIAMTTDAQYALMAFSALSIVTMLLVALPTRVTALGRYIVWSATQHHPQLKTARMEQGDALDIKTLGQAVALYGPDALAGSDRAWIPAVLAQANTSD